MTHRTHRGSVAALALVLCLALSPVAQARIFVPRDGGGGDLQERIVRVIKKIQNIFGVTTNDDQPIPPRP